MLKNDRRDTQLYYTPTSGPCRAVQLVAAALKVKLILKPIDLRAREQFHPGFLKLNPHHQIPVLVDNEFTLSESRAICIYLVEKYGRNDALYPKNPKTRATINQLIYFDMDTLYSSCSAYYFPIFIGEPVDETKLDKMNEAIGFLETFLHDKKFLVGYRMTIADLILLATVSSVEAMGYDFSGCPNITNWLTTMKECAPGYERNVEGLMMIKEIVDSRTNGVAQPY